MNIKSNYHTHNYRCGHATGNVEDYCNEAIKAGLEILGISDHLPFPDNRWHVMPWEGKEGQVRMLVTEIDSYSNEVDQAKLKYKDKLEVLKSMECEYVEKYHNYYREELLGRLKCDYLVGSVHYIKIDGEWIDPRQKEARKIELKQYTKHFIESVESGFFAFMAHPDLIFSTYYNWDEDAVSCSKAILEVAEENNIPLEINGQGMRTLKVIDSKGERWKYPVKHFWELAKDYNIKTIVNSDAHAPKLVADNLDVGRKFAKEIGIKVTEKLIF